MPRSRTSGTSRVSVDDWVQAGYAILAEEGMKALKIDTLCDRLGVTQDRRQLDRVSTLPPREQLSQMMTSLVNRRPGRKPRHRRRSHAAAALIVHVSTRFVVDSEASYATR